ncbi:MAG: TetR/AcrR family transcriptional regulator [Clostridiaceae bacterium]|nr:TetR/AcrR family transcriptional regulator [Clostridiaceae bacterium]MDO4495417.1 TetR/AcrR family transcriptional regulator [Clostridiaceae bacterium]
MNEKFFALPKEKQQAIINAGYKVFSKNSYKKSPVSEIADAAGISKSLLFHYFRNKLELYIFLWDKCAEITLEYLTEFNCYEQKDLFESMYRGMQAKLRLMKEYPDMGSFVLKAFYEKEPEVCSAVQESYKRYFNLKANRTLINLDPEQFIPGLDIKMMYKDMYWACEGYLWETTQRGEFDVEKLEKDFIQIIEFWKSIYLRKE